MQNVPTGKCGCIFLLLFLLIIIIIFIILQKEMTSGTG
jgi:hypothetical protein